MQEREVHIVEGGHANKPSKKHPLESSDASKPGRRKLHVTILVNLDTKRMNVVF